MSTPEEPARLVLESSGASAELRRALGAARGDLPSPDHVEALLAKFPFPDGGGPGGGGGDGGGAPDIGAAEVATGVAKGAGVSKWLASGVFLAASAGVAIFATREETPPLAPSSTQVVIAVSAPATTVLTMTRPEPSVVEPSATASVSAPRAHMTASASPIASASASSAPVRSEIELLKEAHASRSDPARMLALVNESARIHPKGVLGQEREMLRIEALVGLGRKAEAKAIADAFRAANPNSAYARRLDTMFPP